jgi:hypothetical protein
VVCVCLLYICVRICVNVLSEYWQDYITHTFMVCFWNEVSTYMIAEFGKCLFTKISLYSVFRDVCHITMGSNLRCSRVMYMMCKLDNFYFPCHLLPSSTGHFLFVSECALAAWSRC